MIKKAFRHCALATLLFAGGLFIQANTARAESSPTELTPLRSEILLNGKWQFASGGESADSPTELMVPSSWAAGANHHLYGGATFANLTWPIPRSWNSMPAKAWPFYALWI